VIQADDETAAFARTFVQLPARAELDLKCGGGPIDGRGELEIERGEGIQAGHWRDAGELAARSREGDRLVGGVAFDVQVAKRRDRLGVAAPGDRLAEILPAVVAGGAISWTEATWRYSQRKRFGARIQLLSKFSAYHFRSQEILNAVFYFCILCLIFSVSFCRPSRRQQHWAGRLGG